MKQSKKDKVECPMMPLPHTADSKDETIGTSHSEEKIDEMNLIIERERLERTYKQLTAIVSELQSMYCEVNSLRTDMNITMDRAAKLIKGLDAAANSADNVITGMSDSIVKAHTDPMPVALAPKYQEQLEEYTDKMFAQLKERLNERMQRLQQVIADDCIDLQGGAARFCLYSYIVMATVLISELALGIALLFGK